MTTAEAIQAAVLKERARCVAFILEWKIDRGRYLMSGPGAIRGELVRMAHELNQEPVGETR